MSDTQFSSLSPNSSNDLEVGNRYSEDNEFCDQETLSIASNKSIANLEDFDDMTINKMKTDPFLSDFMKEDNEDPCRQQPLWDSYIETNDMSVYYNLQIPENDMDDYLSNDTDCLNDVTPDLLEWDSISPRQISTPASNKRAFSPVENMVFNEMPLPTKQRRVEVSSHVRCDEWVNKYRDMSEKDLFKASGMIDRRKTKHHKILSENDVELQVEKYDFKINRISLHLQKKPQFSSSSNPKTQTPVLISTLTHKPQTIHTISVHQSNIRKTTFKYQCKRELETHITSQSTKDPSITSSLSNTKISVDNTTDNSAKIKTEVVEMPRIPAPLRMGKRVSRRGHRLSLWQFLMCLLDSSKYQEHCTGIKWISRGNGVFHILDSKQVATLWGQYKERRDKMTYDSLARSLRHYYKKNLMAKINNRRLVYQIAQECLQWSSETFLKRNRE